MSDKRDITIKFESEEAKTAFLDLLNDVVGVCKPNGNNSDFEGDNYGQNESKSINKDEIIIR